MIIRKQKIEGLAEHEIVIMHSEDDDETAEKIVRILQNAEQKLLVTKDNVMSRIGLSEILYKRSGYGEKHTCSYGHMAHILRSVSICSVPGILHSEQEVS